MDKILILDFGSQYTQLIARRVREAKVYCEIHPCTWPFEAVRAFAPCGVILSGGPSSIAGTHGPSDARSPCAPQTICGADAPQLDPRILQLGVPVLGICYGMQAMAALEGGKVGGGTRREYGEAHVHYVTNHPLFRGVPAGPQSVWMSHGDHVERVPPDFSVLAQSTSVPVAAMGDDTRRLYGLQFHPEVMHTQHGRDILHNFLFPLCDAHAEWTMGSFIERAIAKIRETVGTAHVVCGVSGGVDSSVVATLLHRAIGDQLSCIFVDTGLLRKKEGENIPRFFAQHLGIPLQSIAAGPRFLARLAGVVDPEEKRKIIGHEFIAVFEEAARQIPGVEFLAQGTLYPDVIESVSFKGPSATIKSHHNVGGLPEAMGLRLLEPLRELFKDEVRQLGEELGMPREAVWRHPFPGPGLAVRILGAVTPRAVAMVQEADDLMMDEVKRAGWYDHVWQMFAVLLPVQTVGVMGDARTYEHVIAIRAVTSHDGMTADWAKLPAELLGCISNSIINEVTGVNRVVYDITSKPPGTIEWE